MTVTGDDLLVVDPGRRERFLDASAGVERLRGKRTVWDLRSDTRGRTNQREIIAAGRCMPVKARLRELCSAVREVAERIGTVVFTWERRGPTAVRAPRRRGAQCSTMTVDDPDVHLLELGMATSALTGLLLA
jgi:hypothetical protein